MQIEISWERPYNFQTKTFKNEVACVAWCRKNYEKIMSINDVFTFGKKLSSFDIMDCINHRDIGFGVL